jgi:hypothetical protein
MKRKQEIMSERQGKKRKGKTRERRKKNLNTQIKQETLEIITKPTIFICAVGLLVLRPLLAYCTSPG